MRHEMPERRVLARHVDRDLLVPPRPPELRLEPERDVVAVAGVGPEERAHEEVRHADGHEQPQFDRVAFISRAHLVGGKEVDLADGHHQPANQARRQRADEEDRAPLALAEHRLELDERALGQVVLLLHARGLAPQVVALRLDLLEEREGADDVEEEEQPEKERQEDLAHDGPERVRARHDERLPEAGRHRLLPRVLRVDDGPSSGTDLARRLARVAGAGPDPRVLVVPAVRRRRAVAGPVRPGRPAAGREAVVVGLGGCPSDGDGGEEPPSSGTSFHGCPKAASWPAIYTGRCPTRLNAHKPMPAQQSDDDGVAVVGGSTLAPRVRCATKNGPPIVRGVRMVRCLARPGSVEVWEPGSC